MTNKIKLLSIALLSLFTVSCNNDESQSTEVPLQNVENTSLSAKEYNNIGNPYETVGIEHNNMLDHYASLGDNAPMGNDAIANLTMEYYQSHGWNITSYTTQSEMVLGIEKSLQYSLAPNGLNTLMNEVYSQGNISYTVYSKLQTLINIMNNIKIVGVNLTIDQIQALENNFMSLNLNADDKVALLSVISIAKYSSNYWGELYNEAHVTKGPWKDFWNKVSAALEKVTIVMIGDVAGGIVGLGVGAGVTALTGGVGGVIIPAAVTAFAAAGSTAAGSTLK